VRRLELEVRQATMREKRLVDELTTIKVALQKSEDEARWLRKKNQELEQEVQDKLKSSKGGDSGLRLALD
jgi:predicted  nucleic acid-binding Zn-ribbon protein